ncbi:MAG TPA: Na+/H+ antiporter NhaC family protein [Candidatus Marinimicrobia bacterium]|nr:Na+/H+ antiporter NhaC family protein [Candidatus Neomarinimicrobiota bacterium]
MNLVKRYPLVLPILLVFCGSLALAAPGFGEGQSGVSWVSVMPPVVAIVLALITRQAHLSLFMGILIGVCIHTGGIWSGLTTSLDTYLVNSLAGSSSHTSILMFTLAFGGLIGVMSANGGLKGIVAAASKYATNNFRGQLVTAIMGLVIFIDDYSNTLLVGNMMRPFTDSVRISREKLSYLVDSTAAPVASLAAISTWSIFQMSLLDSPYKAHGISANLYLTFLQSIPYSFYCIFTLVFLFATVLMRREMGPMHKAETRSQTTGAVLAENAQPMVDESLVREFEESKLSHWSNGLIPILAVLVITICGLFITGIEGLDNGSPKTIRNIIGNSNANASLIWGSFLAGFIAIIMSVSGGLLSLIKAMDAWISGVRSMVMACIILVLAWTIGDVCADMKTAEYIVDLTSGFLTPALLPAVTFFTAAVISFSTGSSWATMSILVPVTVPMSIQLLGGEGNQVVQDPIFLSTFAGVLSGSVFGDHCSPISDTTVLSSTASGSDHIDHVRTQLPYALISGVIALLAGYIFTGLGISLIVSLSVGLVLVIGVLKIFGKPILHE